jgi:hypothetical protein
MASPTEKCAALLKELGYTTAPAEHALYKLVVALEKRSRRARMLYPAVYLGLGLVFVFAFYSLGLTKQGDAGKLAGAVIGVFSALLAFWKPDVALTQDDCVRTLGGKKLSAADLQDINRTLEMPSKKAEDALKLLGALASFPAAYLLLV